MPLSNIFDLTDAILQLFMCVIDIQRLDINISIGMVCRIIFFIILTIIRDINTYSVGEFLAQVAAWFIFHVYILCFEKEYLFIGNSKESKREIQFKIMDTLQLIIGTIYLAFTFQTTFEILILVFFAINLFMNLCEMIYIYFFRKIQSIEYNKVGGLRQMFIGFFLGGIGVIIFLIFATVNYMQGSEPSGSKLFAFILTIIGQCIVVFGTFLFFCAHYEELKWSNDCTKGILGFLYGANIGLFSIFYGYLTGVALFLYVLLFMCKACLCGMDRPQVHPTN